MEFGKGGCSVGFFLWALAFGLVVLVILAATGAL